MAKRTKRTAQAKQTKGWGPLVWAKGSFDLPFLILTVILLTIGLIMLFSASYSYAYYNEKGDSLYFIKRQLVFSVLGLAVMFFISKLNYGLFKLGAYPGLAIAFVLLVVVLILPASFDDFHRWIDLGFISFQPSEVAKVALVLYCAFQMDKEHQKLRKKTWAFLPYMVIITAMTGLVFMENHVSGAILIMAIGIMMMFVGGVKLRWFVIGGVLVAIVAAVVILKPTILPEHAQPRIIAWLDKDYEPLKARWQTNQSLYAIGSGGFLGAGLGQSKQKHLYVSEPQNDFIFAIVCEELGFVGAAVIILLFVLLIWRGFTVAMKAKDRFGAFLVLGLIFQIGLQVALNIAVVTDTLPNTGIGLPFFSYGGTSMMILLAEIGVILSVSRGASLNKT